MKTITLKNGEKVKPCCLVEGRVYTITLKNIKSKEIASINFWLNGKTCYLNRIEVLDKTYSHLGAGTILVKMMESFAKSERITTINGKFYPFGSLGIWSGAFYMKNGFEIYKDGYETYLIKQIYNKPQKEITK